jgi:ABC-type dipeptide/oligopeptide/nickel transport system permease subunit
VSGRVLRTLAVGYLALLVLALALAPWLASHAPEQQNRDCPCARPSGQYLLGTDELGRDVWSRLLRGGRISLGAGLIAAALSVGLGLLAGAAAGLSRGLLRRAVLALAELFMSVPWLYLLLSIRAFLPLTLGPGQVLLLLSAVIGAAGWARPGRLFAQMAGEVREREYVEVAESFGAGRWHLMTRHLLPELRGLAATQFLLLLPGYVLAEVTLTFFGLGVGEPAASWGNLLAPLRHPATAANCLQLAAPLPVLALLVLSCELLGRDSAQ